MYPFALCMHKSMYVSLLQIYLCIGDIWLLQITALWGVDEGSRSTGAKVESWPESWNLGPTNLSDVSVWEADVLMHIVHLFIFILYLKRNHIDIYMNCFVCGVLWLVLFFSQVIICVIRIALHIVCNPDVPTMFKVTLQKQSQRKSIDIGCLSRLWYWGS